MTIHIAKFVILIAFTAGGGGVQAAGLAGSWLSNMKESKKAALDSVAIRSNAKIPKEAYVSMQEREEST